MEFNVEFLDISINWRESRRKWSWPDLRYYNDVCLENAVITAGRILHLLYNNESKDDARFFHHINLKLLQKFPQEL
jgi:hypothetical protein